jgi:glycine oxidase
VVIAGGAWTAKILADYIKPPEIEPVKGQMILYKGSPDLLKNIVLNKGRYLIPRRDGRILAGSTLEHTEFEKQLSSEAKQDLHRSAVEIIPQLAAFEIEYHWAGLRPGSPNGVPYICEHPDVGGLFINSGHYRNGVILGAASCVLLSDLMLGREPIVNPQPYNLDSAH